MYTVLKFVGTCEEVKRKVTIKEVCEKYELTPDTLRYYERVGVIPEVHRTKGGIRDYTEEDDDYLDNLADEVDEIMTEDEETEDSRLIKFDESDSEADDSGDEE